MTLNCTQTVKYVMYIYLRPMEFSTHAYGIFKIDFVYDVDWCVCVFLLYFVFSSSVWLFELELELELVRCDAVWYGVAVVDVVMIFPLFSDIEC